MSHDISVFPNAPVNIKPQGGWGPGDPGRFDSSSFPVGEEWFKI